MVNSVPSLFNLCVVFVDEGKTGLILFPVKLLVSLEREHAD